MAETGYCDAERGAAMVAVPQSHHDRTPRTARVDLKESPIMAASRTLRDITGLGYTPAAVSQSALILIDCQNTYRMGLMKLDGVEEALGVCQTLLKRYRDAGRPIVHIQHDAGAGSPYDVTAPIGAIADVVAPAGEEPVITKLYPSAFEKTNLDPVLRAQGVQDLVLAGFMTHVCVNSTARAAFNHGYRATVVGNATATRSLPSPDGDVVPAHTLHVASLAALHDIFAVVVPTAEGVPAHP
jgi:nicotinamidase-related amidase